MAKYQPVAYNEKKFRSGINTNYYNNAIKNYRQQANKQRATEIKQAGQTRQNEMKQAYLQSMQSKQNLNNSLATAGIRGGATETSNLNIANTYATARNTAATNYTNSVNEINKSTNQNIADYTADMKSRAEEYRQNLSQAKWQAAREDKLNQQNATTDYWNNYYTQYYSGSDKDSLGKALKTAQKKLKTARKKGNTLAATRYEQQIIGIRSRLGVINNK